jgi:hypothetical protein
MISDIPQLRGFLVEADGIHPLLTVAFQVHGMGMNVVCRGMALGTNAVPRRGCVSRLIWIL